MVGLELSTNIHPRLWCVLHRNIQCENRIKLYTEMTASNLAWFTEFCPILSENIEAILCLLIVWEELERDTWYMGGVRRPSIIEFDLLIGETMQTGDFALTFDTINFAGLLIVVEWTRMPGANGRTGGRFLHSRSLRNRQLQLLHFI